MTLADLGYATGGFLQRLERVRTLEYFEGERLVELRSEVGEPWLKMWFDADRESGTTRWFYIRMADVRVSRFLAGRDSLREVLLGALDGFVYAIDSHGDRLVRTAILPTGEIPTDQLPDDDSYYDPDLTPDSQPGSSYIQDFLVERDGWSVSELSELDRRYNQVYSFLAVLGPGAHATLTERLALAMRQETDQVQHGFGSPLALRELDAKPRRRRKRPSPYALDSAFDKYIFKGGWVHVQMFEEIVKQLPRPLAPKMVSFHYSSPGVYRIHVDPVLSGKVRTALERFAANRERIQLAYESLHEDLLELGRKRESLTLEDVERAQEALRPKVDILITQLGLLDGKRIWAAGVNAESAGQVIAAYFRKLDDLHRFHVNGVSMVGVSTTLEARDGDDNGVDGDEFEEDESE